MIYTSAIYANAEHTQVAGTDANGNSETRSIYNPHEFRRADEFITGFLAGGGVIEPYVEPEIVPTPVIPTLYAAARLAIADGDVSGIGVNSRFVGAFLFGVGEIWVFFTDTQPDTDYLALVYDGGAVRAFVREDEKFEDYFIIRSTDFVGEPADAEYLSLEIKRVN